MMLHTCRLQVEDDDPTGKRFENLALRPAQATVAAGYLCEASHSRGFDTIQSSIWTNEKQSRPEEERRERLEERRSEEKNRRAEK